MQCELCGRECIDCKSAMIDNVKMLLCPGCIKHGKAVEVKKEVSYSGIQRSSFKGIRKPKPKDVYEKMDKELVSDWNEVIKIARKKKGLSREDLGFKIGERTVTIAKIENGDLRPSDKLAEKLEKELSISLFEEVRSVSSVSAGSQSKGLTLGDFIKTENK